MAMSPCPLSCHRTSPSTDRAPQTRSNGDGRHLPALLANEAMKIEAGLSPTIRVSRDRRPTPLEISAAKAMSGATAHRAHVTRFGIAVP